MCQRWSSLHSGCQSSLERSACSSVLAAGLYWFVPAVTLGFIGSVTNAWVLLIEILR
jgi:hypothetical protein